ncbi:hypothetical protein P8452_55401 [Trifolium repens]|nr:hypothetical protein P8452_55401 [Trifolium repens]
MFFLNTQLPSRVGNRTRANFRSLYTTSKVVEVVRRWCVQPCSPSMVVSAVLSVGGVVCRARCCAIVKLSIAFLSRARRREGCGIRFSLRVLE